MKKKTDKYSKQTSLIVATLKRLLPVGMNTCAPGEQHLVTLAKNRFSEVQDITFYNQKKILNVIKYELCNHFDFLLLSKWFSYCKNIVTFFTQHMIRFNCQQKDSEEEVEEIIRNILHLQGKVTMHFLFINLKDDFKKRSRYQQTWHSGSNLPELLFLLLTFRHVLTLW